MELFASECNSHYNSNIMTNTFVFNTASGSGAQAVVPVGSFIPNGATLTVEFSADPTFGTVTLSKPLTLNGTSVTVSLTATEVDLVKDDVFRIKSVKGALTEVVVTGRCRYTPAQPDSNLPARLSDESLKAAYVSRVAAPTGMASTDTANIQAAIDAGPGTVLLSPGTYVVAGLTMRSGVHLVGAGIGATALRLAAASTSDVIVTANFAALTGSGNAAAGQGEWSIRDLIIDGNKANAPAGGFGVRAYGYDFDLLNVQIKNCHGDGLYTEFANFGGAGLAEGSMEARVTNVKIHDCGGNGWRHRGPHDSYAVNVIAFNNGGHGIWTEQDPGGKYTAAGTSLVNCHVWGDHDIAAVLDSQTHFVNCQLEGALTGQLLARAGDCSFIGGFIFYLTDVGTNPGYGVRVGDSGKPCTGLRVDTKLSGFAGTSPATAAIDFANPGGSNSIDALIYATGGTQITGTTSPVDRLQIATVGLGSPAANAGQSQQHISGQQTFEVGANNTAWTIQNGQQDQLNFNTNSKRMELVGGYVQRLYSDAYYSTPVIDLNGVLGTVRTYGAATAARPSASAAGEGAMFYDTTLHKPIWSDGTAWRDANGATV